MEVGSSHGQPSSVVRPLKHSGGGVTCTHDPVGEEWSQWTIRWPPRESRWEVHVRVPRKPKAAVLQIPTPHLALAGVMAANNGEWRNKFGPFQSATQAFHDCFEKLLTNPNLQVPATQEKFAARNYHSNTIESMVLEDIACCRRIQRKHSTVLRPCPGRGQVLGCAPTRRA